MFFKKKQHKPEPVNRKKRLYPVIHIVNSLKSYQKELVQKEVDSLWELSMIGRSFEGIVKGAEQFQNRLQEFGQSFDGINHTAEQFSQVKDEVGQNVSEARNEMADLKNISIQVLGSFGDMERIFEQLQNSIQGIQDCMGKIVSIADQTNILAVNASIEAARAGQEGKGFAVVAVKVRELAEQIKDLTSEVDVGIHNVQSGASQLSGSIQSSQEALGHSLNTVNSTYESFQKITAAADGASSVQDEISGVINDSNQALQLIYQFFHSIQKRYQEVVTHIEHAKKLGTTKSCMFEDIDNMMSQIPVIVKEVQSEKG